MNAIESHRWELVRRRDASAGFVFAVVSTGVACRPGCPARTPRRENVRYFESFPAAAAAGFRACKRCAPDDVAEDAEKQRTVARACAMIDADASVALADVAAGVGLSRFHFARLFRVTLGITPGDYRRAARERHLRRALTAGDTVTRAVHAAGYGSPSRAYEARALGMTPARFRAGGRGERIMYAIAQSLLGRVIVALSTQGVCAIALAADDATAIDSIRHDFPQAELVPDDAGLTAHLEAVLASLRDGRDPSEGIDLDVRGTAFKRRVWNALRAIPAGERRTYAQVAAAIDAPRSVRAVARACAANRLALAVPCHRVVGSDGTLRGYRWGVERKAALLASERSRKTSP